MNLKILTMALNFRQKLRQCKSHYYLTFKNISNSWSQRKNLSKKKDNLLHKFKSFSLKINWKYYAEAILHYRTALALIFFDIILIVLFNKLVMGAVLHYFTHFEKQKTTSNKEFSFVLKYTLGLFFTTALMTLPVQALTFHSFYAHYNGVVKEQSIMFIINALLIQNSKPASKSYFSQNKRKENGELIKMTTK